MRTIRTGGARARAVAAGLVLAVTAVPVPAAAASPDAPDPPGGAAAGRSGDGSLEDRSAREIAEAGQRQLGSTHALRVSMTSGGAGMRLTLDEDGNCNGRMDMGRKGTVEIVKRGATGWIKPDRAYWKSQLGGEQGASVADSFKDRYIRGEADDPMMGGMRTICDLDYLQAALGAERHGDARDSGPSAANGTWKRGKARDYAGKRAVPVTHTARSEGDGGGGGGTQRTTLLIAAEGKPYPLEVRRQADGASDVLRLSRFGKPVPKGTPGKKDSVTVSALREQLESPSKSV